MYIYISYIYITYIYMYNIIYCTQPACKCFSQWGLSKGELAGSRGFFPDESGPLGPPQKRRSQSLEPYPSYRMLYYIYISILWLMLILDQTFFFVRWFLPPLWQELRIEPSFMEHHLRNQGQDRNIISVVVAVQFLGFRSSLWDDDDNNDQSSRIMCVCGSKLKTWVFFFQSILTGS